MLPNSGNNRGGRMIGSLIDFQGILILVLIFLPLERLLPNRAEQPVLRRHWFNDSVYLIVNTIIIRIGFAALIGVLMVALRGIVPDAIGVAVRSQPVWLQAVEAIIIADIGFYSAHRLMHAVPLLWRFHSVHHSIEDLDWLAAHRVHVVDQILVSATSLLPLFLLGFSAPAVAIMGFTYLLQSHLVHANTRIGFGPLRWIFCSPRYHHWHHANEGDMRSSNYSAQLTFMDAIFGTLRIPDTMPERYGVDDPVPTDFLRQLVYPLLPPRQHTAQPAAHPTPLTPDIAE
jgi:sterol desaturase/sphingolipid hydroxylase (fatty acid hydroxylase superfamily)